MIVSFLLYLCNGNWYKYDYFKFKLIFNKFFVFSKYFILDFFWGIFYFVWRKFRGLFFGLILNVLLLGLLGIGVKVDCNNMVVMVLIVIIIYWDFLIFFCRRKKFYILL